MEKRLSCRALGMKCDFAVRDESEEAILRKMADHLKTAHKVAWTEELKAKAGDLIRLVEAS